MYLACFTVNISEINVCGIKTKSNSQSLRVLHFILLDCLTALCASSYWIVSLLYVLHLTGLSHCSMCFILLDCLTALCASSYWTVSLLYVQSMCVCVCVCGFKNRRE